MISIMNKYHCLVVVLISLCTWGCDQLQRQRTLPFLGNTLYEDGDTIYHTVKNFELIDQDSNLVTNQTFENQIYVADFFFTSCPTICPKMKKQMLRIYKKYEDDTQVAILSHTIDPTFDTVERLKEYSNTLGVSANKWKFVTGDQESIYKLSENSYMVVAGEDEEMEGGFIHSGAFLLIDPNKHVRGVYDGTQPTEVTTLLNDIDKLIKEFDNTH